VLAAALLVLGAGTAGAAGTPLTAYIVNSAAGAGITPIDISAGSAGSAFATGGTATFQAIAITPDASTAYVVDRAHGTVVLFDLSTNTAGAAITVGGTPVNIAITADGTTAYVADSSGSLVRIMLATNTVTGTLAMAHAFAIAFTPDGATAYVADDTGGHVIPVDVATFTAGTPINVGGTIDAIAITPDGSTVYAVDRSNNRVDAITVPGNSVVAQISLPGGSGGSAIAITPDGTRAYVTLQANDQVTAIDIGSNTAIQTFGAGVNSAPRGIAIAPDGTRAWVTKSLSDGAGKYRVPQNTSDGGQIAVGDAPIGIAIRPDQAPVARFTVTPGPAGGATSFDASASTVQFGSIASYVWDFGDGQSTTTTGPTTSHVYADDGTHTASVTETDSAGTSTARVFTGQTVSRNGGSSAVFRQSFGIIDERSRVMVCTTSMQLRADGSLGLFFDVTAGGWAQGRVDPGSPLFGSTPAIFVQRIGTVCRLTDIVTYGGNPADYVKTGYTVNETGDPAPAGITAADWGAIYDYYKRSG
jgi:YVTN family beta-propeller protein